jgi:predicted amidohydrolase
MHIAMIQMKVDAGNVKGNIDHVFSLLEKAVAGGGKILVLPEMWTTGYALRRLADMVTRPGDDLLERLSRFARDNQVVIHGGSIPYEIDGHIYNSTFVFGSDGEEIASYRKLHLFSLLSEPDHFTAGSSIETFSLGSEIAGLSICYDLRFPELYRAMAMAGASIIFVPAEWPESRGVPWRVLNQARAIENQVYICAVNCVGSYKDNEFYGHSMFVAPDGTIIAEGGSEETILQVTYEQSVLNRTRTGMAVWKDRRSDIY